LPTQEYGTEIQNVIWNRNTECRI